jgi:hypothetical protein
MKDAIYFWRRLKPTKPAKAFGAKKEDKTMRLVRSLVEKLFDAMRSQPALSSFMCSGCELNHSCHLSSSRRRLCCEARALRGRP